MARRKNVKRIDPRYFLEETTHRDDFERLDEFFGPFSKASKIRKYAQKVLDQALKDGEISNARVPGGGYHSVEILPWMGKGVIDDDYPEGWSDALGKAAVYIAKAWLNRDEEDKGFLPDEEKAYKGVFGRAIEDRAAAKSAREKERSDREAADAAARDPKKFQAQLRPLAKQLLQGGNMASDLEDFLDLRGLEKLAKSERAAKYNSDKYIDILAKTEHYLERYGLLKDRIDRIKKKAERLGVEITTGRIDQDMAYIEKRILPRIKASWKKAYKNMETRDKYNYASNVQIRDREGRRGPGSRAAPDMSLADAGADYYAKGGLRDKISNRQRRMNESQLEKIIKEELQKALKNK